MAAEVNNNSKIEQMHQETIIAGRDAPCSCGAKRCDKRKETTKNARCWLKPVTPTVSLVAVAQQNTLMQTTTKPT